MHFDATGVQQSDDKSRILTCNIICIEGYESSNSKFHFSSLFSFCVVGGGGSEGITIIYCLRFRYHYLFVTICVINILLHFSPFSISLLVFVASGNAKRAKSVTILDSSPDTVANTRVKPHVGVSANFIFLYGNCIVLCI